MDKYLRLKVAENSIPRKWEGDQGLIYSRLIVQPQEYGRKQYCNNLFLLTIKKKSYKARDFKEKRIRENYRLEIYPPLKGIYFTSMAALFSGSSFGGSYGRISFDREVFVNSHRGKMFGPIGYRSRQKYRLYIGKNYFKLFESLNIILFKISRNSLPLASFVDSLFEKKPGNLLQIELYHPHLTPTFFISGSNIDNINSAFLTQWKKNLEVTFGRVVRGLKLETLNFAELIHLQVLLDGAQLGYRIIGAKNPLENLFYYLSVNRSDRFIEHEQDFWGLKEFIALWKNYKLAQREEQFLEDVQKFYPYTPFELQTDNMNMDTPMNFWSLDLTMGTKFFNDIHPQRRRYCSTDLRQYMEYIYYVDGPCFLVHYELEKFRNFYVNNRLLKVNVKDSKLPLEILSYLHALFFIDFGRSNDLLAGYYEK